MASQEKCHLVESSSTFATHPPTDLEGRGFRLLRLKKVWEPKLVLLIESDPQSDPNYTLNPNAKLDSAQEGGKGDFGKDGGKGGAEWRLTSVHRSWSV